MDRKIALVTGANKGVGYGIVRQLLLQTKSPMLIYMTSRDEGRGRDAMARLREESDIAPKLKDNSLEWLQLDILDSKSIENVRDHIVDTHGKGSLDVLICNAGIATKGDTFNKEVVDTTLKTNYYATLHVCETFLPLIKKHGRLVNVSSMASKLSRYAPELQKRFRDLNLTVGGVTELMEEFANGVKGSTPPEGWPKAGYSVSKAGVTAFSMALARAHPDVLINAICPGYVNTDMTSGKGPKSIDEGAMTPVHVAIGDIGNTTGKFWENSEVSAW